MMSNFEGYDDWADAVDSGEELEELLLSQDSDPNPDYPDRAVDGTYRSRFGQAPPPEDI